jgi:hypothetical protein
MPTSCSLFIVHLAMLVVVAASSETSSTQVGLLRVVGAVKPMLTAPAPVKIDEGAQSLLMDETAERCVVGHRPCLWSTSLTLWLFVPFSANRRLEMYTSPAATASTTQPSAAPTKGRTRNPLLLTPPGYNSMSMMTGSAVYDESFYGTEPDTATKTTTPGSTSTEKSSSLHEVGGQMALLEWWSVMIMVVMLVLASAACSRTTL